MTCLCQHIGVTSHSRNRLLVSYIEEREDAEAEKLDPTGDLKRIDQ